jgi:nitrous oxidase accessory protein NosD
MTRPTRNALVGNDVRDSEIGLSASGSASFVVGNVVVGNNRGIDMGTQRSLYTKNTFVRNGVGLRTGTIVPTNLVTRNDVRSNEQFVETGRGPTRIWAADGRGNYWGSIPGFDRDGDGVVDRAFRPSGVVDSVSRTPGAATLAHSPAVATMRQFQQAVPGLRSANVVDPAPLSTPARPAVLDRLNQTSDRTASRPPTTQEAGA